MRTIACIPLLVLAVTWSASGAAVFFTRPELIRKAEVIAIITLDEPEGAKPVGEFGDPFVTDTAAGKKWNYSQQAKGRVAQVLKGKIPDDFIVYGKEGFICAQCTLSKGRFLAFLSKDGDLWAGTNWHLSLRPIRDTEVEWYISDEQRYPLKFQKLDQVVAEIQALVKKQQSEQAGAGQPATRPESDSEGSDKPQPEAEGRSR